MATHADAGQQSRKKLFILALWQERRTGIVVHVENIIKNLSHVSEKKGKNFEFYILTYGKRIKERRKNINSANVEIIPLKIIDLPILRALSYITSGFFYFLLKKENKNKKIIIHAHYALPQGLLGMLLKVFFGYRFFITFHGSDVLVLGKKPLLRKIIKAIANSSDRAIAVSSYLKEELVNLGVDESKIEVVYNGVEMPAKNFKLEGSEKRVIFIGSLVKQKSVDSLIRAFKTVESSAERKSIGEIWLFIIGDGKERKKLEKLAEKLGVKNIKFFGYVSDFDKILTKNSCVVLPSQSEGFGIVILEAMIRGVPVIARRIKSIEEIAEHGKNALLFENENELAEAIIKVFKDEKLRKKLSENGKKHAAKFTWEKAASKIFEFYES